MLNAIGRNNRGLIRDSIVSSEYKLIPGMTLWKQELPNSALDPVVTLKVLSVSDDGATVGSSHHLHHSYETKLHT
jgi:hypothetical protein